MIKRDEFPKTILEFLDYLDITQNRSPRTVEQYSIDMMLFTKFLLCKKAGLPFEGSEFDRMSITEAQNGLYESVTPSDVMEFLSFAKYERQNGGATRARKMAAIRGFYKFHNVSVRDIKNNPIKDIETPKVKKALPKFLELEESVKLLETCENDVENKMKDRDYAILTLFLNCGMRLSELASINMSDLNPGLEKLVITGKGSKQRIIYLNDACRDALARYIRLREGIEIHDGHRNALFVSSRGQRISIKTVQWMVYKYLDMCGLGYKHLSVHKLRHTAATLMYQTGKVDIRVMKDILGHEQLNTTQIYTHVSDKGMQEAMEQNPLSGIKMKNKSKSDD